jgi:hypothetical protein
MHSSRRNYGNHCNQQQQEGPGEEGTDTANTGMNSGRRGPSDEGGEAT